MTLFTALTFPVLVAGHGCWLTLEAADGSVALPNRPGLHEWKHEIRKVEHEYKKQAHHHHHADQETPSPWHFCNLTQALDILHTDAWTKNYDAGWTGNLMGQDFSLPSDGNQTKKEHGAVPLWLVGNSGGAKVIPSDPRNPAKGGCIWEPEKDRSHVDQSAAYTCVFQMPYYYVIPCRSQSDF